MLQDKTLRAECSFFREHPASCVSPLVHFMCSSPFLTLAGFCSACALNSGSQGDILTVIRRLDENWIEAKSGDKVGVCPLQFTEVSSSAPSGFSLSLSLACSSSAEVSTPDVVANAPPARHSKVSIALKLWPLCCVVLKWSAELCRAAASADAHLCRILRLTRVRRADCRLPLYLLPPGINFSRRRKKSDTSCWQG